MKKLGKKVKRSTGSLEMYAYCMCTNCACTVHVASSSAKYARQHEQNS